VCSREKDARFLEAIMLFKRWFHLGERQALGQPAIQRRSLPNQPLRL
jgi:hypothetical protein